MTFHKHKIIENFVTKFLEESSPKLADDFMIIARIESFIFVEVKK